MTRGPVLGERTLEQRLERDGFVKVELLARDVALDLGAARAPAGPVPPGRWPEDPTVAAVLGAFVGHRCLAVHVDRRSPGTEAVALHRGDAHVDERAGARSHEVVVALSDLDGSEGQLRVVRHSHRVAPEQRGPGLPAIDGDLRDALEPRVLSIPLRAGEAVVLDSRTARASYPNHAGADAVTATVLVAPRSARILHLRAGSGATVARYDLTAALEEAGTDLPTAVDAALASGPAEIEDLAAAPSVGAVLAELDRGLLARRDRIGAARARAREVAASRFVEATGWARRTAVDVRRRGERLGASAGKRAAGIRPLLARWRDELPTRAAIAVLGTNEWLIDRFAPPGPAVIDTESLAWVPEIERAFPEIRAEVEALLVGPTDIPHIQDVAGGIPQGNVGIWRSFVLFHQGQWMEWNCRRCPRTEAVLRSIPGLTMGGFSVLEAGTHITTHRGPNKGALRHQMGVIVPGADGDCRIRVGDEVLVWREGESVAFDFTVEHEAWNDSDATRVLLMTEFLAPLPWFLRPINRIAQRAMSWFPTTRNMKARLAAMERELARPAA